MSCFLVLCCMFFWQNLSCEEIKTYKEISKELSKGIKAREKTDNRKIKVAVLDFSYYDKTTSPELASISESLSVNLVKMGVDILERRQIDEILKEKKIQRVGIFDESSIIELGTFIGADAILTGTIEDIEDDKSRLNIKVIDIRTSGLITGGQYIVKRSWSYKRKSWLNKTIYQENEYYYAVGKSELKETENKAIDEARERALSEFVKYCGSDITTLNRVYESYSDETNKGIEQSQEIESSKQVFARAFVRNTIIEDKHIEKGKKGYIAWVLVKIPKSEYERIQKEKSVKLSMDIALYYEDEGEMKPLTEGMVLKSGEGYSIYVNPSDTCYLYVYNIDETGNTYRLFPNSEFGTLTNPIVGGKSLWLPNEKSLYILDENTGREEIFIFASLDKIEEMENGVNLKKTDLNKLIKIKKMGVGGIREKINKSDVKPPSEKIDVVKIKNKIISEGGFYYTTWFLHK